MLYNIFPGGNTILHLFIEKEQDDDLEEVFKLSQPNMQDLT